MITWSYITISVLLCRPINQNNCLSYFCGTQFFLSLQQLKEIVHNLLIIMSPNVKKCLYHRVCHVLLAQIFTALLFIAVKWQAEQECVSTSTCLTTTTKSVSCASVCYAHTSSSKESWCACKTVITRSVLPPFYFGHDQHHPKHTALNTLWKT